MKYEKIDDKDFAALMKGEMDSSVIEPDAKPEDNSEVKTEETEQPNE